MPQPAITLPTNLTACATCKIQLAYPPTSVNALTTIGEDQGFYYITAGTPYNLSYIGGSNNTYISGSSTKAILHKRVHMSIDSNAELTIIHKSTAGDFYLVIPLIKDDNANNSLSNFLNDGETKTLELGSFIYNADITHYLNNSKHVFVVAPIKCKLPSSLNDAPSYIFSPTTISNAQLIKGEERASNDEVVCDYEGDETEDSTKSSAQKNGDINMAWAIIVSVCVIGITYVILSKIENRTQIGVSAGLFAVCFVISLVLTILDETSNKGNIIKQKSSYKGIFTGTSAILTTIALGFYLRPAGP